MSSHLLSHYVQIGIALALVLILFYQFVTKKILPLGWILTVVTLALVRSVFDFLMEVLGTSTHPIAHLEFLITALSFFILYLYLELTLNNRPYIPRFTFMVLAFGMFLGFLLYTLWNGSLPFPKNWPLPHTDLSPSFFELPFDIFAISVWVLAVYTFYRMFTHSLTIETMQTSLLLTIASLIFLIVQLIEVTEFLIAYEDPPDAAIVALPGFLLIVFIYIRQPDFSYSSPVKVYRLMVFHENGPVILNLTIDAKYRENQHDPSLVGGLASSLNTAYMEITKQQSGNIKKLDMEQVTFIFTRSSEVFAILEIERSTHLISTALRRFMHEFADRYAPQIEKARKGIFNFKGYEDLFNKYFPFVVDIQAIQVSLRI